MKAKFYKILFVSTCFFSLTACHEPSHDSGSNTDYIAKEGHCIVTIPKEYDLVYENIDAKQDSMQDIDLIQAETVEGKPKNEEFVYFSVLLNEPFRIMTPVTVIQDKNNKGQTLTEWKVNGICYQDEEGYLSKNVYTCVENTIIEPKYSDFRTVGIVLYLIDEEQNPKHDIFDESGQIIEQEDVFYFYGPYDFDANKASWKTNMDLAYFDVSSSSQNEEERYVLSIRFDLTLMLKKGTVAVKSFCEIVDHGYMMHPTSATQIISGTNMSMEGTFYVPISEHTLQCTFMINM